MNEALPIDPHVGTVRACLDCHRAAVLVAAPGAGKTTRVPPALADARPGDRAAAAPRRRPRPRRAASPIERGWTVGDEVGWHVRFERRFTAPRGCWS